MTKQERIDLINEARELKLKSITIEGITYELGLENMNTVSKVVPDLEAGELLASESVFDSLTDEEILYWSTPEYDNIQAKKQQHEDHLKNKEVNNG